MDQAEQLRNIIKSNGRTVSSMARIITVTSGKGGVGKSNTAINLAIQLKKAGKKVIILDADFGLANIEIMFGIIPKYNLSDLIYKGKSIREIITWGPMGIGFISGGSGITKLSNLTNESIQYIVQNISQLDELADVIIIDTGAGISYSVMRFLIASPEILLIITPEPTSITDAYSLLKALASNPYFQAEGTSIRVVSNKAENELEGRQLFSKLSIVIKKYLNIDTIYAGTIPNDVTISKAVMQQVPISIQNPNAKATRAYEILSSSIIGDGKSCISQKGGISTLFARIIGGR